MYGTELIKHMLNHKKVEKIGASGWIHTPGVDRGSAEEFSKKIIELTDYSKWDFIKIMSNGVYMQEAYGSDIEYMTGDIPLEFLRNKMIMKFNSYLVNSHEDMKNFPVLDVENNKVFNREAALIKALADHYKGTVPIIPTIFLPLHTVPEFCGGIKNARSYMENNAEELEKMLESLLETELQLVDKYIAAGADGFFFASRYSNSDIISRQEFERFCLPYEERLLNHIKDRTWFNMVHIHGTKGFYFDYFEKYPVQAFNWENVPSTVPEQERASVEKVRAITDKILITGTDQFADFYGTPEEVHKRFNQRIEQMVSESKDNRVIFSPGCSLPLDIDHESVHMLRVVTDEFNEKHFNER